MSRGADFARARLSRRDAVVKHAETRNGERTVRVRVENFPHTRKRTPHQLAPFRSPFDRDSSFDETCSEAPPIRIPITYSAVNVLPVIFTSSSIELCAIVVSVA